MEYQIVILGDSGVGKTCLLIQMIQQWYPGNEPHEDIGEESYRKLVTIDQETCLLNILDSVTSYNGEELSTNTILLQMYTNKDVSVGFLLVYSSTSRKSFTNIEKFRTWILKQRKNFLINGRFPVVLVATQCDQTTGKEVEKEEAVEYAREYLFDCPVIECSAKEGTNVQEAFFQVVREIRQELAAKQHASSTNNNNNNSKKKNCYLM
jgi:GTPase KRas